MHLDQIPSFPTLSGEVFDSLPESIRSYIRYLETTIQQLGVRVHELEARLSKDSSNSSKPPGSDGLKKKTKSLRGKSDKKQGAQNGHAGKGLAQVGTPDLIVIYAPANCHGCGLNLDPVDGACAEKRQVFDIPQPKIEVTEHQAFEKQCPCCGELNRGVFPENIRGPVQYGDRIQALTAYFAHQHFIPVDRVCQIFEDVFGISISPGTCSNCFKGLGSTIIGFHTSLMSRLHMDCAMPITCASSHLSTNKKMKIGLSE